MSKPRRANIVARIAARHGRDYVTPEDVTEALQHNPADAVGRDLLAVIGRQTRYGIEDAGLCAFVAWEGWRA